MRKKATRNVKDGRFAIEEQLQALHPIGPDPRPNSGDFSAMTPPEMMHLLPLYIREFEYVYHHWAEQDRRSDFIHLVLAGLDHTDLDVEGRKEARRTGNIDTWMFRPSMGLGFEVIRYVLENLDQGEKLDQYPHLIEIAVKWLQQFAPNPDDAVRLLSAWLPYSDSKNHALQQAGFWAAVHLSEPAPQTPGLATALGRAFAQRSPYWRAQDRHCSCRLATVSNALANLGSRAEAILPALIEAALGERQCFGGPCSFVLRACFVIGRGNPLVDCLSRWRRE